MSSYPLERCELVGTIPKMHTSYIKRSQKAQLPRAIAPGLYDRKGPGKETQENLEREVEVRRECIDMIFCESARLLPWSTVFRVGTLPN